MPPLRSTALRGLGALLAAGLLAAGAAAQPAGFAPVSIYPLDNGRAVDQLGRSQPGQVNGAVPTADRNGVPNAALYFDGVNDFVQTFENSNVKPLTFSVWFRADAISGEHSIVDSDRSGGYGHSLIIGYDDPATRADTPRDGSLDVQYHNGFWDTGRRIETGRWYHAFVTYGAQMRLYLDGELVAEKPYPETRFDGSTFRFGRHNAGDPQWFKGAIDDVRFYNEELPAVVIAQIAVAEPTANPPTTPPSPTRVAVNNAPIVLTSHGDVHMNTPDGLVYDYQAAGEFLAVRSSDGYVVVQTRQEMWDRNPQVSINTAAAFQVGADRVEFYLKPTRSFYVNGQATGLPSSTLQLPGGGTVAPSGPETSRSFVLTWPDGRFQARALLHGSSHMDVGVRKNGDTRTFGGLFGNLDGNAQNDLTLRAGGSVAPPAGFADLNRFGDSWRLGADETLFRGAVDAATPERPLTALDLDAAARAAAEQRCRRAGVSDRLALGNCTYDVAATGDDAFVASAKTFQDAVAAAPPVNRVPGDLAGHVALRGTVFPIAQRFELQRGTKYPSESGNHYLIFQDDGNLVVYTKDDGYVWGIENSGKEWARNNRAVMQEDGNLVTYDGEAPIWASDTFGHAGAALVLTPTGELQIVRGGRPLWTSTGRR